MKRLATHRKSYKNKDQFYDVVLYKDAAGNVVHRTVEAVQVKFFAKDVLQVIIGATLLAIPIGMTEETWVLAQTLPLINALALAGMALFFVGAFSYYHYYIHRLQKHMGEFAKRVFFTYIAAFIVCAVIMTVIQKAPWGYDFVLALKRVLIVTLPASMGAAVADVLK